MGSNSFMLLVSYTLPKPGTTLHLRKRSLESVVGYTMCRANITSSAKRMSTVPRMFALLSCLLSVSTLRSAIELKSVFDQIQAAERAGNLSPEDKKKLEEQAAEKGLQALFKVLSTTLRRDTVAYLSALGSETRDRVRPARDVRARSGGSKHNSR